MCLLKPVRTVRITLYTASGAQKRSLPHTPFVKKNPLTLDPLHLL